MNYVADARIKLPKKLEGMIDQKSPIQIFVSPVQEQEGISIARIRFNSSEEIDSEEFVGMNTSLALEMIELNDDLPDFQDTETTCNLFANSASTESLTEGGDGPVEKLVETSLDKKKKAVLAAQGKLPEPTKKPSSQEEMFEQMMQMNMQLMNALQNGQQPAYNPQYNQQPTGLTTSPREMVDDGGVSQLMVDSDAPSSRPQNSGPVINSWDDLRSIMEAIPGIENGLPPSPPANATRQELVKWEQEAHMAPRLPRPVYVTSNRPGLLEISDIGLTMQNGEVKDISKIPAAKLLYSRDLQTLINNGLMRFASDEEYHRWYHEMRNHVGGIKSTIPVGGLEDAVDGYLDSSRGNNPYAHQQNFNGETNFIRDPRPNMRATVATPQAKAEMERMRHSRHHQGYPPQQGMEKYAANGPRGNVVDLGRRDTDIHMENYDPNDPLKGIDSDMKDLISGLAYEEMSGSRSSQSNPRQQSRAGGDPSRVIRSAHRAY